MVPSLRTFSSKIRIVNREHHQGAWSVAKKEWHYYVGLGGVFDNSIDASVTLLDIESK